MANLIRFDWAVKKLLRNKANFDVLEGFLAELLGFDVKIEEILESESNKEHQEDKFNRVDMLVRSNSGELMLIEIQNDAETDYFHRILYGTSKLITEHIKEGEGYATIKKTISISILYFRLGQGKDYVYEYEGKFVGKHLKDTLKPNVWQKGKFGIQEVADIFPKYYILKVNNFNDIANTTLDEWIYFLKNSEVPDKYSAKGLKEASEKLRIDQLSEEERKEYQRFKENRWIEKDVLETAEKKGAFKNRVEIAKKLIKRNLSNEDIAEDTGLLIEQIHILRTG
ncbi:MAG: Rpn family recombination-promoting nuclease/putative transposase, partial [Bacteroidetes bacterium]